MRMLRQPHWQGLGRTQVIALGVVLALWLVVLLGMIYRSDKLFIDRLYQQIGMRRPQR